MWIQVNQVFFIGADGERAPYGPGEPTLVGQPIGLLLLLTYAGPYVESIVSPGVSAQSSTVLVPSTYNASNGAPLVIYHHGVGEGGDAITADALKLATVQELTIAGYIVAGSAAYGENLGNSNSLTAYVDLYTYVTETYNVTRTVAWSQSMGGMSGLLSISDGSIPYVGWLGTYPVCDLRWMYDNGYSTEIKTAYGIASDGSDYATETSGHDPLLLLGTEFDDLRMRFYASASDSVVSKEHNSDEMAVLVTDHAVEHVVVVCTGNHGDTSHFQSEDYISFFDRCV